MGGHSYQRDPIGGHYQVLNPAGQVVIKGHSSPDTAARKAEALDREARETERPCITCRAPFMSEGAHNRMCPSCRERGPSIDVIGHPVGLPTRTGVRG